MNLKISDLDLNDPQGRDDAIKRLLKAGKQLAITDAINVIEGTPHPDNLTPTEHVSHARDYLREADRFDQALNAPTPVLQEAPSRESVDNYQMPFLIDNWMPANRLTILTGPGGIGKSYLALQHGCGLALGVTDYFLTPYHGTLDELYATNSNAFRKDPIKVVIASYEEDLHETWKRIALICDTLGWADYDKLTKKIRFVDLKLLGPVWGVQEDTHLATRAKLLDVGKWLLDECHTFGAGLLVLDPSAGAFGGSEIARESVREFCSHLNGWGQSEKCATMLIAHPPKSGEDYSGSTDWLGSCRALWTLRAKSRTTGTTGNGKETHQWYQLTNVKQNYASPQREIYLEKSIAGGKGIKGHTPVWIRANTQEDAEAFHADYHTPPATQEGNNGVPIVL